MIEFALLPVMAVLARQSGGGLGAQYLKGVFTRLPEALFALPFGYALSCVAGPLGWLAAVWSYAWMESGHGAVLTWGKKFPDVPSGYLPRRQTLSPVVDLLADKLGVEKRAIDGGHDVNYCRLFMAVKGFLIGLPVGGVLLAVLWPLGYEIGKRFERHALAEVLSGFGAGISIAIFLILVR